MQRILALAQGRSIAMSITGRPIPTLGYTVTIENPPGSREEILLATRPGCGDAWLVIAAATQAQSLTERFAFAVELVLRGFAVSLPRNREVAPLALGTWNRLKRLVARFSALVAAVEAGRLFIACRKQAAPRTPRPLARDSHGPAPKAYGWLLTLAPELNTRIGRAQIETLLADPALLALLAQAPQAGRILRPLCHMLRIERPDCLRLPPRPRRPRPPAATGEPNPAPTTRPGRPKPSWLGWPKSPPLPGMARAPGTPPTRRTGTGPPED
ncbi:MAG: hypothetical protein JOZ42_17150 [Acetobacteraceae bacterium]|nr:hypothetical protein [Acetobacteraceae bacterium]